MPSFELKEFIQSPNFSATPFQFDRDLPGISTVFSLMSNQVTNTPSHNINVEVHGAAIHNLAVRVAARRYVEENANFGGLSTHAAVEALCLPLVQDRTMACIFAKGGLDYNILRVSRSTKRQVFAFVSDPACNDPPKELASFMKVHAWGIDFVDGIDTLVRYYYDTMSPLFQSALSSLRTKLDHGYDPELPLRQYVRLRKREREAVAHVGREQYMSSVSLLSCKLFAGPFQLLADAFDGDPITYRDNGDVGFEHVGMLALGDSVLQYFVCQSMDSMWPEFRVAVRNGPEFCANVRRLVLCDESIALVARKANVFCLPPAHLSHTNSIEQTVSVAVGKLYLKNPPVLKMKMYVPVGVLLETARSALSSSSCFPVCPASLSPRPWPVAEEVEGDDGSAMSGTPSASFPAVSNMFSHAINHNEPDVATGV